MRYWGGLPIVLGLGWLATVQARAAPIEVLVPLFIEKEYQGDVFIYLEKAQPTANTPQAAVTVAPPEPKLLRKVYKVQPDDTLYKIARLLFNGDASKWKVLYEENKALIPDRNVLTAGIELVYYVEPPPSAVLPCGCSFRRTC